MEVYEPTAAGGGTSGTGSVTISGSDRSYTFDPCPPHGSCPQTIWDGGTIAVTVNGVQAGSTGYGSNTTSSLASALASSINGNSSSPVTASASGSTVYLTAKTTGSSTNYSLSASSYTQNTQYFSGTSFPVSTSGSTLTGGQNAVYSTVYDSGTCTITVNSHGNSTTWSGSGTSGSSIASALVSGINGDSAAFVTASASGSVVNLTAKGIGSGTDYSLASSCSYDTSHFSSPSFTPSNSGSTLTGGADNSSLDVTYNFADPVSGHNAGVVYGITNNLDSTRSQTFSYDQLNRITSALTTSTHSTSPAHCWGENYTLDAWANLNSIAATTNSAYTGCTQESGFSTTADGNNHLPVFGYDSSGNTLSDGAVTNYQWDAESQLNSAAGVTYTYDGDGRRVAKVGSKLYWYGSGGDILAETNTSGAVTAEYIFFGGKRIAMLPAGGNPTYYVEDLLGTSRVLTTNTGVVCYDADFYPYGGERSYTNTCPQNYKFEGKERDTETGNDDFGARYYSNRFGRWLSADWSAVPAPVPYANLTNPQTLNLYSMVADDPESFADLDGHDGDGISIWDVINFAVGAINAYASDNLAGAYRMEQNTTAGKLGAAFGDVAAATTGTEEVVGGAAGVGTGLAISGTGAGAVIGVPLAGASGVVAAHGAVTDTVAAVRLGSAAADAISGAIQKSSTAKPHGNTAGNQPAELYEKYDKNGNFEKHGVSQDASKRYSKKEVDGGTVKVTDRGPRKEMLKKERQNVETNPGPKNKEPWAGKRRKQNDPDPTNP